MNDRSGEDGDWVRSGNRVDIGCRTVIRVSKFDQSHPLTMADFHSLS